MAFVVAFVAGHAARWTPQDRTNSRQAQTLPQKSLDTFVFLTLSERRDIINILKKSSAGIEAAKIKTIPDVCSNCKSEFPTFARIKTQKLPFS